MAGDSVGSHSPSPAPSPSPNPPGVMGDSVRHVGVGRTVSFDVNAAGFSRDAIDVHLLSPSKRPSSYRLLDEGGGIYRIEFTASDVGSYVADVTVGGRRLAGGPLLAKAYNSGLIRVTDVGSGVVGQPCQFRVDASQAGEGQLEISVNDGELPNHVQVLGGGRCLVSFTPEQPKAHTIDIKFNGETVSGCPFIVKVADTSHISVTLRSLELIPVDRTAKFHIAVDGTANAELAVSVRGPTSDLPVKVSGNVRSGFTAEFTPREVGPHTLLIEYNGLPVPGTPFLAKAYDARRVEVSPVPRGAIGRSLQFTVDASQAGEGNLEITITARGRNVPTQVHPQGSARFTVSFVPLEAVDHMIAIAFNKEPVPGSPLMAMVQADPHRIGVSGQGLSAAAVGKTAYFSVNNVSGSVEDLEVNVEGPGGMAVPAQVTEQGAEETRSEATEEATEKVRSFRVEFSPRTAGEHRVHVAFGGQPVAGSPFSCKVYDVGAIRVKEATRGVLGKPVTFLVETSLAGPGNLEVTVNGGQVPTSAQAQGPHTYAISFTPKEAGSHVVELRFNGESVPGSPFTCQVADASRVSVSGEGLEKVAVGKPAKISIQAQTPSQQLGEPEVHVTGPSRHLLPVSISSQGEGRFSAEYIPTEVGDHTVEVKLGDQPVPGSPFVVKAYDATKVKVTNVTNGTVGKPLYFSIDAGQAGAGNLEIIVSVGGRNVPNYVQAEGNARFCVNFKPSEAAAHTLSVRFNGEPVPGSPFTCKVRDSSLVQVAGPGLKMAALGRNALVTIDPKGVEVSECSVSILSPSGQSLPVTVSGSAQAKFHAEFVPAEVGPHSLSVLMDNEPVGGSPFVCNVYDVNKVKVTGLGSSKVGKPVTFTVDASQAGEGTLELVVTSGKASVRAEVTARSRGLYDVTFVPHEASPHFVNITFNDEDVPESPFRCQVSAPDAKEVRQLQRKASRSVSAMGDGLQRVQVGGPAFFHIDPKGLGDVDVRVQGPHGLEVPCRLGQLRNGLYRAEYTPEHVGTYLVTVFHSGQPIGKQPYAVSAFDPQQVVAALLGEVVAGKEAIIRVSTVSAGAGALSVTARAVGKAVKHSVRAVGGDVHEVRFTPRVPVPHRVDIRFNGVPVPGSPIEVSVKDPASGQAVTASGAGLHQARTGRSAAFVISTLGAAAQDFDVVISGPKGEVVPVRCYQQRDGNLLAEFQPTSSGTCKIEVTLDGKPIRGSPFYCQVYDPTHVKIVEVKDTFVVVGENIVFKVTREEAGFAELEVVVTSPLGRNLPIEVKGMGDQEADLIEFTPSVPGRYKFAITYGGEEVSGSPITFLVEEEGTPKVSGPGLTSAQVGTVTSFRLDARGIAGQPHVQVDGPDSIVTCEIKDVEGETGVYVASYTPQEVGVYDVRVFWNGREIAGSPYHPRVLDPSRVRIIGGWEALTDAQGRMTLIAGKEKRISFDIAEAGPGQLKAELHGPTGIIPCTLEQVPPSRIRLGITPSEPGDYQLHLLWNEVPLPNSPMVVIVPRSGESPEPSGSGDAGQVVLTGRGLASARCGEEAEFSIDGGKAGPGSPEVTINSPKAEIQVPVQVQAVGGGIYKAIYAPSVAGTYLLNVTWAGRQVKGCPLKINVVSGADASKVVCTGDGLRLGTVGREIRSFIDTRRAGPGELTAQCAGPRRGAYCELYDHGDGTFTLNVRPQEAGRHTLTIKYGGDHVPGSPFPLRVLGAPDASKVRVYGPGIEHGVLAIFQSRFICDTRGAGAGQLTVRIRGPKGAFRVEMQRESQKDRTILCKFDPTEPGDYRVEVKWAGEHVPGSPFLIMIFDTQEELNRFLQGNYSPQPGATSSSEFYGSNGYSTGVGHMSFGQMSWRGSQAQL